MWLRPKSGKLAPKVLQAVSEGRSCRWIARDLGISKNAVLDVAKRRRRRKDVHSRSAQHQMRGQSPVNATRSEDKMPGVSFRPLPKSTPGLPAMARPGLWRLPSGMDHCPGSRHRFWKDRDLQMRKRQLHPRHCGPQPAGGHHHPLEHDETRRGRLQAKTRAGA